MNSMAMYGYHTDETSESRAFARLISMDSDAELLQFSCTTVESFRVVGDEKKSVPKLKRLLEVAPCIEMKSDSIAFKYTANTLGELMMEDNDPDKISVARQKELIHEFEKAVHDILIILLNTCGTDKNMWKRESKQYILDSFALIFNKEDVINEMEFMFDLLWNAAEGLFFGCSFAKECWPKWKSAVENKRMVWLGEASSVSAANGTFFSSGLTE